MEKRSIGLCIVLSIITCGIYGLVWIAQLNDELYEALGETPSTSGGMVVLFSILTCNIYAIYWYYKMGEKVDKLKGIPSSSNILFPVLCFFGLGVINNALMQDALNGHNSNEGTI